MELDPEGLAGDVGANLEDDTPLLLRMTDNEFQDLVISFFAEILPEHRCPMCGHDKAHTTRRVGPEQPFLGLTASEWKSGVQSILYVYALVCWQCGNFSLHSYAPLERWYISKKDANERA